MSNNFIVTTTSTLEGYEIKKYLGAVSAHVVAGTGLFSDMAAGFRDIFGGRSLSYQKQLSSIKSEVLENLKQEAKKLGANSIVGLTIDFDEISGGGKSMFMVTAMGTATIVNQDSDKYTESGDYNLSGDQMNTALRKEKIIAEVKQQNVLRLTEEDWLFIIVNKLTEITPYILTELNKIMNDLSEIVPGKTEEQLATEQRIKDVIVHFPPYLIEDYLYQALKTSNYNVQLIIMGIIEELELVDLKRILEMLNNIDIKIVKIAIQLLKFNKQKYTIEDIAILEEIIIKLREKRSPVIPMYSKKQVFSSKNIDVWRCNCGKENETDVCDYCGSDIYGFYKKDYKPNDGIEFAEAKLKILKNAFREVS